MNTSINTTNNSSDDLRWGFLGFVVIFSLSCIICNALIIIVFTIEKSIRNRTNVFVVSLACADLVVGLVSMPLWIIQASPDIMLPRGIKTGIDLLCCSASIFNCALLSLERALKITRPYWYTNKVTTERVRIVIVLAWVAAIFVGFLPVAARGRGHEILYISALSTLVYIAPVIIITLSYISILVVARRHSQKIRNENANISGNCSIQSDAKTAARVGIFIGIFIICWTPVFIQLWIKTFTEARVPVAFSVFASTIPYLNAVINPFLYAIANPLFRKGIKNLYAKKRLREVGYTNKKHELSTLNTHVSNYSPPFNRLHSSSSAKMTSSTQFSVENQSITSRDTKQLLLADAEWETTL